MSKENFAGDLALKDVRAFEHRRPWIEAVLRRHSLHHYLRRNLEDGLTEGDFGQQCFRLDCVHLKHSQHSQYAASKRDSDSYAGFKSKHTTIECGYTSSLTTLPRHSPYAGGGC